MVWRIIKLLLQIICISFLRRERLEAKIKKSLRNLDVIIRGEHVLSSGLASEYYLDIKKSFGYPRFLILYSIYIAKYFYKKEYTCIVVSGYGGIPIGVVLSVFLGIKVSFIRDKYKNHGKIKTLIDGYVPNESDCILFMDDVFTTGDSIKKVIDIIKKETKARTGKIIVICSRVKNPTIDGEEIGYILIAEELRRR